MKKVKIIIKKQKKKMYEKYINEIIDLLFMNTEDYMYKEQRCKEIYKILYKQGGEKSVDVFNNLLIERFHENNYSNDIICKLLSTFN